jgi:hypothetical protein
VEFYPFAISDSFAPECLDTDWLLGQFGAQRAAARRAYKKFVLKGRGLPSPLLANKHQSFRRKRLYQTASSDAQRGGICASYPLRINASSH